MYCVSDYDNDKQDSPGLIYRKKETQTYNYIYNVTLNSAAMKTVEVATRWVRRGT